MLFTSAPGTRISQQHHDSMMDICQPLRSDPLHNSSRNSSIEDKLSNNSGDCGTPSKVLQLLWKANSFIVQGLRPRNGGSCVPLVVGHSQIGILLPHVAELLTQYTEVFQHTSQGTIIINPQFSDYSSRSSAVAEVLQDIRASGATVALRSWRGENFHVWGKYGAEPIMEVERAAVALLGIRAFGVHVTGYVRGADNRVAGVWLQKRADDKPTYPGMMDTMVGGGITAGLKASEVLFKEAAEEASVPGQLVERATAAGTVSFLMESERGLHANVEHVHDIELPVAFEPENSDGEVQGFVFVPIKDINNYLFSPNYKLSSTPILIDFLIRHGILTSDSVSDFPEVVEMLHSPLSHFYRSWPSFPAIIPSSSDTQVSSAGADKSSLLPYDSLIYTQPSLDGVASDIQMQLCSRSNSEVSSKAETSEDSDVRGESEEDSDGL